MPKHLEINNYTPTAPACKILRKTEIGQASHEELDYSKSFLINTCSRLTLKKLIKKA